MDPLTHVLLTGWLIGREPHILVASVLPDLPFYVLYPGWVIRKGLLHHAIQSGDWPIAPAWMQQPHHLAHCLPLVLGIALLLFYRSRRWPEWIRAWALHILIDIPTHSENSGHHSFSGRSRI